MDTLITFMINLIAQLECQLADYRVQNTEKDIQICLLMEENEKLKANIEERKKKLSEWNPLAEFESSMYDTFMSQSKIGNHLSFIYRNLNIKGRFRTSPNFGNTHDDWRMCLTIHAKPEMKKALSKYNAQLDDITGLGKAIELINDAANEVEPWGPI